MKFYTACCPISLTWASFARTNKRGFSCNLIFFYENYHLYDGRERREVQG
jgi:hypothetical protein